MMKGETNMALMRPFSDVRDQMEQMFRDMDEFQLPSLASSWRMFPSRERAWFPPVDVSEANGSYLVQVEVPGVKAQDLNVEILDDAVIVRGQTQEETTEEKRDIYRRECHFGSVYRRIPLPGSIKSEGATAELDHGRLRLTLPKQEEKKGRKIAIQSKK
jgi:HSP20 family protein